VLLEGYLETYYPNQLNTQSNSSDDTVISVPLSPTLNPIAYPEGGMADFRVRAMAGGEFPLLTIVLQRNLL
jgi:hypothetical protein